MMIPTCQSSRNSPCGLFPFAISDLSNKKLCSLHYSRAGSVDHSFWWNEERPNAEGRSNEFCQNRGVSRMRLSFLPSLRLSQYPASLPSKCTKLRARYGPNFASAPLPPQMVWKRPRSLFQERLLAVYLLMKPDFLPSNPGRFLPPRLSAGLMPIRLSRFRCKAALILSSRFLTFSCCCLET